MTIETGDIIEISGRAGRWVAVERVPSGAGKRWRLVQWSRLDEIPRAFDAGEHGMTLAHRPAFAPGDVLQHWGQKVEVIEDRGALVRIFQERRKPVAGSAGIILDGEAEAFRWQLVAENVNQLAAGAA